MLDTLDKKTWQLKLQRDENLPDFLVSSWTTWKEQLTLLDKVDIPHCYLPGGCHAVSFQLHNFSDASKFDYGTVSFLRRESKDGTVSCSFVMAKSRTTPFQYGLYDIIIIKQTL